MKVFPKFLSVVMFALSLSTAQAADMNVQAPSWQPYADLPRAEKQFMLDILSHLPELVGNGEGVFALSHDLDDDGIADTALYFANRDECGVDGCLYILFYSAKKNSRAYTALDFKITSEGLMLDGEKVGGEEQ